MRTLLLLFMIAGMSARAQHLVTSVNTEYTISGAQYGLGLAYSASSAWSAGIFLQHYPDNVREMRDIKRSFYGAVFEAPLCRAEKLSLLAKLRCGLVNERFVVVTPSVETLLHLSKNWGLGLDAGLRMGSPSVGGKIYVYLF